MSCLAQADTGEKPAKRKKYVEVTPREHTSGETALYLASLYGVSGVIYYFTSTEKIHENASLDNFSHNFGRVIIFDTDSPNANWIVHVYSGSQCYLFYRGRSYTKTSAFLLTALQSALFEFTIEVIQEKASLEDLINTPILGSILGRGFELASIDLLNSDSWFLRTLGHLINLPTLFGFNQGVVYPIIQGETKGLGLQVRF